MTPTVTTATATDNLPPKLGVDYKRTPVRSTRYMPQARAHESVIVPPMREPSVGDLVERAKKPDGGDWLAERLQDVSSRRLIGAVARRHGEQSRDHEAEAYSLAAIRDLRALQDRLDFDVTVKTVDKHGNVRMITTSAFALAMSNLAATDAMVSMESVPTVVPSLVTELDDTAPNTEVPEILEFPVLDMPNKQRPKPLGETENYREIGASEDRYTGLTWKDGYWRSFSQDAIDKGGPFLFAQLSDLGTGSMEVIEFFSLRDVIDFDGSAASGSDHVMIRNRVGAALFSATANTPSARTPNGTRLTNTDLVDLTDLEAMRARLATMRNSRGAPAPVPLRKVLVPDARWVRAWTLLSSSGVPGSFNEVSFFGPDGPGRSLELLSTPLLDYYATGASAGTWYGGDPQRQFVRKWKLRPEVAVHGGSGTLPFVMTREGFRVRIGWDCKVFARSHTRWVQALPGTTSPKDA